jgi:hypothetical protein
MHVGLRSPHAVDQYSVRSLWTLNSAIKSGGHNPNNGFASIQDGLLVSTKNLDQVAPSPLHWMELQCMLA